jgi:phage anti-repressor protein
MQKRTSVMDETVLIKRAAEVEWMASDAKNANLRPYFLEVARTYRRLAKMERTLRPRLAGAAHAPLGDGLCEA